MNYPYAAAGPTLHYLALGMLLAMSLAILAIAVLLASLRGRIAAARCHPQAEAVNVCGWLGLPTGILWVMALAWAYWRYSVVDVQEFDTDLRKLESSVSRLEMVL
jgi:hypothetical protein